MSCEVLFSMRLKPVCFKISKGKSGNCREDCYHSVTQSCLSLYDPKDYITPGSLSCAISWSLLRLVSIEAMMLSNQLIFCHLLLLLPSILPSMRIFSNESALCTRWPKYWSFNIIPCNEYSRLISFRINWFDLLAVQGTLKSLLQQTAQKHQFFGTQPSLWSSSHIHTWLLEKT